MMIFTKIEILQPRYVLRKVSRMKNLILLITILLLIGCDETTDPNTCLNSVEVTGVRSEVNIGYIVTFEQEINIDTITTEFLNKYQDLTIFNTYQVINGFHGDFGPDTLEQIQCEDGVNSIEFNSEVRGT
jgi:hypothetical protein